MCRLRLAVLMRAVDDDIRSFVGHPALSFTLEKRMPLVRNIYIDSRTCSGNPADFTATLPEPIHADPTLSVILSQLTFVNNFETVMRDYTNRLYLGTLVASHRALRRSRRALRHRSAAHRTRIANKLAALRGCAAERPVGAAGRLRFRRFFRGNAVVGTPTDSKAPRRGVRDHRVQSNDRNLRAGVCLPEWLRGWT